jgi:hypothetical protein
MAGNGNNLASPPYFCKVSLDARGTADTPPGELGKYEEGWSGKDRLDQTVAYHTRIHSFTFVCLGSTCQARSTLPARTRIGVGGAIPNAIISRSCPIAPECVGISIVAALLDAIVSRSFPSARPRSRERILDSTPRALRALSIFLRCCISNNHSKGVLPSHILRVRGGKLGLTR